MTLRAQSLRGQLLLAMVLPALIAIAVAFLLYLGVEQQIEHAADQRNTDAVAANLAHLLDAAQHTPDIATLAAALPDDQVTIVAGGQPLLTTPLPGNARSASPQYTASARFSRGTVTVMAYPWTR